MWSLLVATGITVIIESFIAWLFLRSNIVKIILYVFFINFFTLPLATFTYQYLLNNFVLIEFIVFIVESVLIYYLFEIKFRKAILVSLVINLTTSLISLFFI